MPSFVSELLFLSEQVFFSLEAPNRNAGPNFQHALSKDYIFAFAFFSGTVEVT